MTEPDPARKDRPGTSFEDALAAADIGVRRLEREVEKVRRAGERLVAASLADPVKPRAVQSTSIALNEAVSRVLRAVQTPDLTDYRMERSREANRSQQAVLEAKLHRARVLLTEHGIEAAL